MNEILFTIISYAPGPFWLILAIAPKHKIGMKAFDIFLILLSIVSTILTIPLIPELMPILSSPKLHLLQNFLSSETGTLGTWNHMILSDLWIGRWVTHDSIENQVSWFIRIPILFVILFFGPVGLCFHFVYRILFLKKIWLLENK